MKRAKSPAESWGYGPASAYGAGLCQRPGQQGRAEDRIVEECRRRAYLPDREVVRSPNPILPTPFHDRTVVVTSCGRLCLYRKKINLSKSLAGQAVGVKEVDTGIWLVSFMDYDLGYMDLEERTLQPLETPFGPKVLPMS